MKTTKNDQWLLTLPYLERQLHVAISFSENVTETDKSGWTGSTSTPHEGGGN
jgi:hypothetical protein